VAAQTSVFAREVRTMRRDRCEYCGAELDEIGIEYRGRFFCSDECCEEYEQNLAANGEPDPAELKDENVEEMDFLESEFTEDGEIDTEFENDGYDEYRDTEF
jgi:hypothetical protein